MTLWQRQLGKLVSLQEKSFNPDLSNTYLKILSHKTDVLIHTMLHTQWFAIQPNRGG